MIVFAAAAVASWSRAWIMQADAKIDPSVGLSAIAGIGTFVGDDAPLCPRADHRHERTFGVCGCAAPPPSFTTQRPSDRVSIFAT